MFRDLLLLALVSTLSSLAWFIMYPSLQLKLDRFEELERQLQDPAVLGNGTKLVEVQREYGGLKKTADSVRTFQKLEADLKAAQEFLAEATDDETKEYAQAEVNELSAKVAAHQSELEDLVTAGDSITRGGLIMEIRAGDRGRRGGPVCAGDLFNKYTAATSTFAAGRWNSSKPPKGNGRVQGSGVLGLRRRAYHRLQFESGGHRVQRVPETETQGASIPAPQQWLCCRKPAKSKSTSRMKTCRSTRCAPVVLADRRSTRPNQRSASHTSPRALS